MIWLRHHCIVQLCSVLIVQIGISNTVSPSRMNRRNQIIYCIHVEATAAALHSLYMVQLLYARMIQTGWSNEQC